MKLRNKLFISIGIAWVIFLAIILIGTSTYLLKNFLALENERSERDLTRIDQALDLMSYSLYTFTSDWGHWNDLYTYMQGKNPKFVPNNINLTAFLNSTINLITYWNKKGELVLGVGIDTETQKLTPFPTGFKTYIYPGSTLLTKPDIRGYIALPSGIYLVATSSITDSNKKLPPLGTIVAARFLSNQLLQKIEETTKLPLTLYTLNALSADKPNYKIFQLLATQKHGHYSYALNTKKLAGFTLIRDINDKPIGMFEIITPRLIYTAGMSAIRYYLTCLVILAIVFSLFMLWLLKNIVVKRLERLDKEVANITSTNTLTTRVTVDADDELSSVATEINYMLDTIEASHDQLEQRVIQRTHELQETNTRLQHEITERKSIENELIVNKEHLVRLAHYDNLTSLPNRIFFNEIFNKALSHAGRQQKTLALLFIDLDRFKNINDALGHPTGDLVLKEIAHRFAAVLRAGDILARLGGDEFIILLNDIGHPKFASPVAEKLLQACAKPVRIQAHEFFITASIGICVFPNDGTSLEDLQRHADMAMYKAKRAGGGVFHYFTKEMNLEAHAHIQLEAALRKAIANDEFVLHYQPKLNVADGSIAGVEALIRWDSPEHGLINPAKFIPLAEETGLIMQVGEWALREACRTNKHWQSQGYKPIVVAVNLSPKQFRHQDIAQLVASILAETQLEPKYLELEITETAVMDNVERAIHRLSDIKQMGVEISVDDFGTGYSSINYLKQFPLNNLKIDQSFIKGIPNNQNDVAITSAVIAMAHNLSFKVVAEGVETSEQFDFLAEHQCDMVQGYYLSRPLPETKIVEQFTKMDSLNAL